MTEVTAILNALGANGGNSSDDVLPLVYQQLRELAHARLSRERDGVSLDATELVHDAYIRLVNADKSISWESRGHFFAAAAEAMRRILVERARQRQSLKRGGNRKREVFDEQVVAMAKEDSKLIQLHEALERLEKHDPERAKLVKLRYFAGFSVAEAAQLLAISKTKAERSWAFTKAWLQTEMNEET